MEFTPPKRCRASYPGCGYLGRCLRAAVDDQSSVEVFQVRALLPGISKRIAYWQRAGSYCVDACLVWWPSTMPTARFQIEARRAADDAVSKAFSAASRGAQSPSKKERPGRTAERMFQEFFDEGFESRAGGPSKSKSIIEVHSHVALLGLMRRGDRIRYKVTKTATYRKALDLDKGRVLQLRGWRAILDRLGKESKVFRSLYSLTYPNARCVHSNHWKICWTLSFALRWGFNASRMRLFRFAMRDRQYGCQRVPWSTRNMDDGGTRCRSQVQARTAIIAPTASCD